MPGGVISTEDEHLVGGRYRLSGHLGSGGMGTVWAGRDELLRRDVALKEVWPQGPPGQERRVQVERTRREARAAAAVASPAVMTVYDVVEEGERTWIVMERLPPRTLADVLAEEGPLDPAGAASIGLAVLDALDAAHAVGVLHRDVKPGNVMWGPGGRVVLADFGIALAPGDTAITQTGVVLGSPAYLAPERARGGSATAASDLWGLGALLHAAVEGHPPFDRDGALATLTAVVVDDVPPAPHAGPLAPVIEGLLRKDPLQRMTSAQARPLLARAVRRAPDPTLVSPVPGLAAAPGPAPAALPPAARRTPPHRSRRRGLVLVAAVAVVLAAVALVLTQLRPSHPASTAGPSAAGTAPASSPPATPSPATPSPARSQAPAPAASRAAVTATSSATSAAATTPTATSGATPSPSATASRLRNQVLPAPAGLQRHTDPTGFTVAVPAGWRVERTGGRVYLRDPASSRYLMVDQTDHPQADPLANWQQYEPSVAGKFAGYRRVRLARVQVPGAQDAADLEFTFGSGARTHVVDRNLLIDSRRAYALYWSAPDATWQQQSQLFDAISASFVPAP